MHGLLSTKESFNYLVVHLGQQLVTGVPLRLVDLNAELFLKAVKGGVDLVRGAAGLNDVENAPLNVHAGLNDA